MTQLSEGRQFEIEMMRYKVLITYAILLVIAVISIAVAITVADVEKTRIKAEATQAHKAEIDPNFLVVNDSDDLVVHGVTILGGSGNDHLPSLQ